MTNQPHYRKIDSLKIRKTSSNHRESSNGDIPIFGSSRFGRYKSPMRPARFLIGVLLTWIIFSLWLSGFIHQLVPSLWKISRTYTMEYVILNLGILITISFYGSLIWWTLRVARNSCTVHQRPRFPTIRPGRIAISWILPIVAGFIPYYTLNKVRKESLMNSGATSLLIWWIGWGIWPLIALIIIPGSSFFIDDILLSPLITIIDWTGLGFGLISTAAAIIFITKLSKHQSRMRPM